MKGNVSTKIIAVVLLAAAGPAAAQSAAAPSAAAVGPPGTAANPTAATRNTPLTRDTVTAIANACLPLLRGAKTSAAVESAGFRLRDGVWTRSAGGKSKGEVELDPPDVANPHLCTLTVSYRPGGGPPLGAALEAWAGAQSPPLTPVETNRAVAGSPNDLTNSTWSGPASGGVEGVVLSQEKPAAGHNGLSRSTVLVSLGPT